MAKKVLTPRIYEEFAAAGVVVAAIDGELVQEEGQICIKSPKVLGENDEDISKQPAVAAVMDAHDPTPEAAVSADEKVGALVEMLRVKKVITDQEAGDIKGV